MPNLPEPAELINMAVKEKITVPEFKNLMRRQGFDTHWSDLIWKVGYKKPKFWFRTMVLSEQKANGRRYSQCQRHLDQPPSQLFQVGHDGLPDIGQLQHLPHRTSPDVPTMTEAEQEQQAQAMRWGAKGLCEGCGGFCLDGPTCWMCMLAAQVADEQPITIAEGQVVNQVSVAVEVAAAARESLKRMIAIRAD